MSRTNTPLSAVRVETGTFGVGNDRVSVRGSPEIGPLPVVRRNVDENGSVFPAEAQSVLRAAAIDQYGALSS